MKVTSSIRLQARLQSGLFIIFVITTIGLLAWLSTRYVYQADWTMNNRYTLSEVSQKLLEKIPDPVTVVAYASNEDSLRLPIKKIIARYQIHKADITLRFVDPFTAPAEVRQNDIKTNGELLILYHERKEHVQQLSEKELTAALERLVRNQNRQVLFLQGHKERNPSGTTDHDFNEWSKQLKNRGFEVQPFMLAHAAEIPQSQGSVFVIADPQTQLLPEEVTLITDYIDKGGNLLWLLEPGTSPGLDAVAAKFGLTLQPGMLVDPSSQHPAIVSITHYGKHALTSSLDQLVTLFPQAGGLKVTPPPGWQAAPLLITHPQAWSETGPVQGEVKFDESSDVSGPLNLAFALSRPQPAKNSETTEGAEQRVIIVGESDFLANAFLPFGGNLDLGLHFINWLAQEDTFIDIPTKVASDSSLQLSIQQQIFLGLLFILILPLGLISTGIMVWWRRRKA